MTIKKTEAFILYKITRELKITPTIELKLQTLV
jgi:hypothetical protein